MRIQWLPAALDNSVRCLRTSATRSVTVAVIVSFVLTACRQNIDLAAIAALAKSTSESQGVFASLADDFHQSCVRTVGWQRAAEPLVSPNVFSSCTEEAKAARQWQSANSIVTSYVASLGALAGGASDPGDYGLTNFSKTLTDLGATKAFSDAQNKAVVGAVASLINDYFNIKRRAALAIVMASAQTDLDTLTTTLEDAARTNYITQLTTERTAIQLFFEPNIARAKPGVETLYAFRYRATEREEQAKVDARQAAVDHYIAALEQIRTAHHKVVDAVTGDRFSDVAGIVRAYLSEYKRQVDALHKAFP